MLCNYLNIIIIKLFSFTFTFFLLFLFFFLFFLLRLLLFYRLLLLIRFLFLFLFLGLLFWLLFFWFWFFIYNWYIGFRGVFWRRFSGGFFIDLGLGFFFFLIKLIIRLISGFWQDIDWFGCKLTPSVFLLNLFEISLF